MYKIMDKHLHTVLGIWGGSAGLAYLCAAAKHDAESPAAKHWFTVAAMVLLGVFALVSLALFLKAKAEAKEPLEFRLHVKAQVGRRPSNQVDA